MGIKIQSKKKIDFVTDVTPRVPTAGTFFVCKNGLFSGFAPEIIFEFTKIVHFVVQMQKFSLVNTTYYIAVSCGGWNECVYKYRLDI